MPMPNASQAAVTPRSLPAANNSAPISSAAKAVAPSARYLKRLLIAQIQPAVPGLEDVGVDLR
jgi:hypothetical protein